MKTILLLFTALSISTQAAVEINGIAAKVNGRVVTKNEVAFMLAPMRAYLASKFPRKTPTYYKELNEGKNKILDELIERELVIHHFKDLGANIPDHVVESEIRRKIREDFNNNESLFRKELQTQGLSYAKFKELTHRQLIVQAMRARQFADVAPATPGEMRTEYNKVREKIRDMSKDRCDFEKIFIPKVDQDNLEATPETQLKLTEEIVKKLKAGGDFAELAKKHSKDGFADEGGKQTDVARTDLAPVIAVMMFEEPTDSIIGPLEDGIGYHIIRVNKKHLGPSPSLSDPKVRTLIQNQVQREKSSARYNRWIDTLKRSAMIEKKM